MVVVLKKLLKSGLRTIAKRGKHVLRYCSWSDHTRKKNVGDIEIVVLLRALLGVPNSAKRA